MLELIVYPKSKEAGVLSFSPFCAKSEALLRFAKIDFKCTEFTGNPAKFSNSKLPVLRDGSREIHDSALIEAYLVDKFSLKLDDHLSETEKAQGFAFSRMQDEYLYWAVLCERWLEDENFAKLRDRYFAAIPSLIRPIMTGMIRSSMKKSTIGHGMGRHDPETRFQFGKAAIDALAQQLGDKPFLFGDQISSYDLTAHSFISNCLYIDLAPKLQAHAKSIKSLEPYAQRVFELL
ncbi:MAG: glutathione S-transferase family protein [Alphaproteobacteria bacterium]